MSVDVLDLSAGLLVLLALLNVGSTVILVRAALRHRWPALEERATIAVILALAGIVAATLGLARLHVLSVAPDFAVGVLVLALVAVSVPSLVWLIAYLSGRFDE